MRHFEKFFNHTTKVKVLLRRLLDVPNQRKCRKACCHLLNNQAGQSLVQLLISVAIMGIMMVTFASMMTNQQRETQALTEKMAAMDFQQALTNAFADGTLCTAMLGTSSSSAVTLKAPGPQTLSLAKLPASSAAGASILAAPGSAASAISNNLTFAKTKTFELANIVASGPGQFDADFQVNYEAQSLVRALKPAIVHVIMKTTGATVNQCIGVNSLPPATTAAGPIPPGTPCNNNSGVTMYGSPNHTRVCCGVGIAAPFILGSNYYSYMWCTPF